MYTLSRNRKKIFLIFPKKARRHVPILIALTSEHFVHMPKKHIHTESYFVLR